MASVFAGVVREKPDFAEFLVFRSIAGGKVVRTPVKYLDGRLAFASNPHIHVAVLPFIINSRTGMNVDLECHPFIGNISKTIALAVAGNSQTPILRIEAVR